MKPARRLTSPLLSRKGTAAPSAAPASRLNMVKPPHAHAAAASPAAASRRAEPAAQRLRVSLRLDRDRHVRLKRVARDLERTMQSIFTQAIDEFLERHDLDAIDPAALRHIAKGGDGTDAK